MRWSVVRLRALLKNTSTVNNEERAYAGQLLSMFHLPEHKQQLHEE